MFGSLKIKCVFILIFSKIKFVTFFFRKSIFFQHMYCVRGVFYAVKMYFKHLPREMIMCFDYIQTFFTQVKKLSRRQLMYKCCSFFTRLYTLISKTYDRIQTRCNIRVTRENTLVKIKSHHV